MRPTYFVLCFLGVHPLIFGQSPTRGSIEGQVIDAVSGTPVQRASVSLTFRAGQQNRPGEPPIGISASRGQYTDAEGRFAFRDLGAGSYQITPQRQGSEIRPG